MNKNKIGSELLITGGILLVIAVLVLAAVLHSRSQRQKVSGTYSNVYQINGSTENEMTVSYRFDDDEGTYEEYWGDKRMMTGTYTVDGGTVSVVTDGNADIEAESEELTFYLDGDILIPAEFIYEGALPEGETFHAEVSVKDSTGMEYRIVFEESGRFVYYVENSDGTTHTEFTYKRKGNRIRRYSLEGTRLTDFYIYKGQLAGIFYERNR